MNYTLLQGDNRETLKTIPDNSIDAIITDPPYGIGFLGKSWDANTGSIDTYKECLRVLKPGGHILAFSAARTYHHLAITLEQAGFEIRDQIMWIYSSGFPKSQDVGKQIDKAAGKADPNYTGSKKKGHNLAYGSNPIGGRPCGKCGKDDTHKSICVDTECGLKYTPQTEDGKSWAGWGTALKPAHEPIAMARKPVSKGNTIAANCQQWGTGAININATRIESETLVYPANGMNRLEFNQSEPDKWQGENTINDKGRFPSNVIGDIPDYQKFFYCPKVNRKERHMEGSLENIHPTVKPIELMKYLIKLVTPRGGTVLDPFNGSGSTGCAAVELGHTYIGCELDAAYIEISKKRIEAWNSNQT